MKNNQRPACGAENYICPIIYGVSVIGRKWHLPVLCILEQKGTQRYGQLKRFLPGITDMMLTQTLKDLGTRGLVRRVQYNEIPPRVEYSLTAEGESLSPSLRKMAVWGAKQVEFSQDGPVCQNCMDIADGQDEICSKMQREPEDWDKKHLEAYEALCSDPEYADLPAVEKIKKFVLNAITVLTHNDQEYTRLTYLFLMNENTPVLVGNDRQYYIILHNLVEEARREGGLPKGMSTAELMDLISVFQTGMIVKWRLNQDEEEITERNKAIIDWFFENLK